MTKNMTDFQAIKAAVDILEIARQYVELRQRGREWVGPCPICRAGDDRFWLNPQKQIWGCRVCGTGGDVINLVAKVENITNGQAAQRIAGGSFSTPSETMTPVKAARIAANGPDYRHLQLWSVETVKAGIRAMTGPNGEICRQYLDSRGISQETAKAFRLGFNPAKSDATDHTKRPALVIPWIEGSTVTAIKYRFIDDLAAQDKSRRFTQRIGSQAVLFGCHLIQSQQNQSLSRARALVAVEGEINAATIYQSTRRDSCDVVSVGPKRNQAALDALDQLITRQKYDLVVIWLDEFDDTVAAGERLRHHRPKLMKSPNGMDANDILRTHGKEAIPKIIQEQYRLPRARGMP
jgi:hypothetical protein